MLLSNSLIKRTNWFVKFFRCPGALRKGHHTIDSHRKSHAKSYREANFRGFLPISGQRMVRIPLASLLLLLLLNMEMSGTKTNAGGKD